MAIEMLTKVGLKTRMNHKPKEMSGGQQQRVGIARAFVAKPEIVFADEPTGNLDTKTTMEVMDLIKGMARENKQTIVMVTHDPRLAEYADKIIRVLDGNVQSVEVRHDINDPNDNYTAEAIHAQAKKQDMEMEKQEPEVKYVPVIPGEDDNQSGVNNMDKSGNK